MLDILMQPELSHEQIRPDFSDMVDVLLQIFSLFHEIVRELVRAYEKQ